ncbi:manganese efflux pump MntP family protein [Thalassobacillus devorans]|uniref:manganese efflux pump MntP n=1 Tax=Thalassobacillus devorans TaxID=279813 RepID=UPI00048F4E4A|nr:manganese efflux pump MntP family protein [Thalassobacillus devorans]
MESVWLGEVVSLSILAFALGLDAFSVSLGMGMQRMRLKRIFFLGLLVGIFHMIMPFIGIIIGQLVSAPLNHMTMLLGGMLLIGIGAHMFFSSFREDKKPQSPIGIGVILFAFSVSVDSFSAGLSLGLSGVGVLMAVLLFGFMSMSLTWTGFLLGRKAKGLLGVYSELLGGSILCAIGLNMLF